MQEKKNRFANLLLSTGRCGVNDLVDWINKGDMFVSPASTKHHGAIAGGLLSHSVGVYDALVKITNSFGVDSPEESKIIVALCHDLCKINTYKQSTRNVKNEQTGQWEKVPVYIVEDDLPLGHGEKSCMILQRFIKPTVEELMSIRWHMGGYDDAARGGWGGSASLSTAQKKYPLAVALHLADMAECYLSKE